MTSTLKTIIAAAAILCLSFAKSFATMNVTKDPAGDVIYKQTFKLNNNMSEDDAYEFVQQWFTQNPGKFTRQSGIAPNNNSHAENKAAMEQAFSNKMPLQSLDPESKRIVGRTMVKYYGGSNSSIQLMYIEYYVVLEITGHDLTATISQIKYHHFSTRNYTPVVIYSWQGGNRPFDSADKFQALTSSSTTSPDITAVSNFLTSDMNKLLNDLHQKLQTYNALANN